MANTLPMTLRVYQQLSHAMVPLAPALIKRRLKLGKEDPARIGERRGLSQRRSAERSAGVDLRRQRRRGVGGGGVDRKAARAQHPHSADLGDGDVGCDRRQAVSARHHPSICAVRLAALRRAISRPLAAIAGAVHRIRSVAESDHGRCCAAAAHGADQRPDVAPLVPALAPGFRHHLRAARPLRGLPGPVAGRCRSFHCAGQPQRGHDRQSETRCRSTAGRSGQAGAADGGDARPTGGGGGLDPFRRGGDLAAGASHAVGFFPQAIERDRASACQPR